MKQIKMKQRVVMAVLLLSFVSQLPGAEIKWKGVGSGWFQSACTEASVSGCTIAGNVNSGYDGSGIRIEATAPTTLQISSSVIAGNGASGLDDVYDAGGVSAAAITYSCVGANPGFTGTGILVADPKFKRPMAGDFRLRDGSPCRDLGVTEPWMVDALDLDGNPRVQFGAVDMGAYELGAMPGFVLRIR